MYQKPTITPAEKLGLGLIAFMMLIFLIFAPEWQIKIPILGVIIIFTYYHFQNPKISNNTIKRTIPIPFANNQIPISSIKSISIIQQRNRHQHQNHLVITSHTNQAFSFKIRDNQKNKIYKLIKQLSQQNPNISLDEETQEITAHHTDSIAQQKLATLDFKLGRGLVLSITFSLILSLALSLISGNQITLKQILNLILAPFS